MLHLTENAIEIIDEKFLFSKINNFNNKGENWTVKAGFDPTSPDIHLGHTVLLNQLAKFQENGAIVQLIIGDFTATIGDPTGKNKTRKILNREDIVKNAETYKEQVFKILNKDKTDVFFNSEWLDELGTAGMIQLAGMQNVARMLERNDFEKRYKAQEPIAISEFLYPLLQGYDSVHLKSDCEIGGTDQKFNLLMGRQLQRNWDLKEQSILMLPILVGLDGKEKMSKSLDNYIGVDEEADSMFGKIMSISDDTMWEWFKLLSFKTNSEIQDIKSGHPKTAKEILAIEIITRFHTEDIAIKAVETFNSVFKEKNIPDNLDVFNTKEGTLLSNIYVDSGLISSTSEFRRKIKENAIKLDGKVIDDFKFTIQKGTFVAQFGKKKFLEVISN